VIEECCSGIENVRKWKCSRTVMRICPVCPVMEIIVPVDVTDVEQEAAQALWDLQDQPVPEAVREFRVLWVLRDRRGNREYRDIREPRARLEQRVQRESSVRREQQEPPALQE